MNLFNLTKFSYSALEPFVFVLLNLIPSPISIQFPSLFSQFEFILFYYCYLNLELNYELKVRCYRQSAIIFMEFEQLRYLCIFYFYR